MDHFRWGILIPMTAIIITVLLTYILAPDIIWDIAHHDEDETHDLPSYKDFSPSVCGNSTIRFPFGRCGALSAHCMDNQRIDLYDIKGQEFYGRVMGDITESSYSTRTLPIAQDIVYSSSFYWLNRSNFLRLSQAYTVGTIYNCTQAPRHIYKNVTWLDWVMQEHPSRQAKSTWKRKTAGRRPAQVFEF